MKNLISYVSFLFFLIYGCDNNPVAVNNVSLNTDFNIAYGGTVYIPGENLSISFANLLEESRCPQSVDCVWEGNAKIKLIIRQGGDIKTDTVQTYLPQSIVKIGEVNNSYLFRVKNVEPYPQVNKNIDTGKYVLTLNVKKFTYGFQPNENENKTGIFGQIFIGPTSPVSRRGYVDYGSYPNSTFKIVGSKFDTTEIISDSTGRFIKYLPPGEYHIVQKKVLPILIDTTIYTVNDGKMSYIILNYFSGKE